eukprot:scaffold770_cov109-Cylindrotheca_fusiformis.AAC.16
MLTCPKFRNQQQHPLHPYERNWMSLETKGVRLELLMIIANQDMGPTKISLTPAISPLKKELWQPLLEDEHTQSYAYYLSPGGDGTSPAIASWKELDRWFQELHPSNYDPDDSAWTTASYKGELLLRKTAWTVFDENCKCEYG